MAIVGQDGTTASPVLVERRADGLTVVGLPLLPAGEPSTASIEHAEGLMDWCAAKFPDVPECVLGAVGSLFFAGVAVETLPDPTAIDALCTRALGHERACLEEFFDQSIREYVRADWNEDRIITDLYPRISPETCARDVRRGVLEHALARGRF